MITGIGVDLIKIERVKKACEKEGFLKKCFTDDEIEPVKEACERARLAIECIISTGIEQAMSRYNG